MRPRPADPGRLVRLARQRLSVVRMQLGEPTPASVNFCVPALRHAIEYVLELERAVFGDAGQALPTSDKSHLREELGELRRELAAVTALLEAAAVFYRSWSALVQPAPDATCDYRPGLQRPPAARESCRLLATG